MESADTDERGTDADERGADVDERGAGTDERAADIEGVHAAVEAAIAAGAPGDLRVLGYGEMTLVIGWPTQAPTHAVKRLPPFATRAGVDAYARLVRDYIDALAARGVLSVPTEVVTLHARGGFAAYLVQPMTPPGLLLDRWLADGAPPEDGLAALTTLARGVAGAADATVGLDGQVSNWARTDGGSLALLDLTTPMLCDAEGRERLDTRLFTAVYPWVMRAALRRFVAPQVMADFHRPRQILTDAASNLLRQGMDEWMPVMVQAANVVLPEPLTRADVERYYRSDTRLWGTTERLRRTERWWQRSVRRRAYPMLLAPPGGIRPPRRSPFDPATGSRP